MTWLLARVKEPSTHAAIAGVIAAFMPLIPPPWGLVAAGVFGALGFALPAGKP
jgi:hypothetical protein